MRTPSDDDREWKEEESDGSLAARANFSSGTHAETAQAFQHFEQLAMRVRRSQTLSGQGARGKPSLQTDEH